MFNRLLLHIRRVRSAVESAAQEIEAEYMVTHDYGGVGDCHDAHGDCKEL